MMVKFQTKKVGVEAEAKLSNALSVILLQMLIVREQHRVRACRVYEDN